MAKFLIIRFSSIGDIVLTTPVMRCLKLQYKNAEIHYLTKNNFRNIVEQNPYITKVISYVRSVNDVIDELKAQQYDYIIDLHHNMRSTNVILKLRKPFYTLNKLNLRKFLLVNFKVDLMPQIHIVDRYMETVSKLGIVNDNKGLDFFIPEKDQFDLNDLPSPYNKGFIAFVIGAQHFTKRLPNDKIITICKLLNQPVLLIGGKEDISNGKIIANGVGGLALNATGQYNLFQSAWLVKNAIKVITHDTGMMHIAAAFNKKMLSVWGNTVPQFGMYPYMPQGGNPAKIIEVKGLICRPCSKIGKKKCPLGHFKCMKEIDPALFL